jgi:hypothetical protein
MAARFGFLEGGLSTSGLHAMFPAERPRQRASTAAPRKPDLAARFPPKGRRGLAVFRLSTIVVSRDRGCTPTLQGHPHSTRSQFFIPLLQLQTSFVVGFSRHEAGRVTN